MKKKCGRWRTEKLRLLLEDSMALVCRKFDCTYTRSHGPIMGSALKYCPDCGSTMEAIVDPAPIQPATRMLRFGGFLIDRLMLLPFDLMSEIPIAGPLIIVLFRLLRDINGQIGRASCR